MAYDKTIDLEKHESDLTDIADAIREATESTEPIDFPQEYIDTLSQLVNKDDILVKWIDKQITEMVNDKIYVGITAESQRGNTNLKKVDLPKVPSLANFSFGECANLSEVNLLSATTLGTQCFSQCKKLTKANLPLVTTMGAGNFGTCTTLPQIYMPNLETITGWGWNFNVNWQLSRAYFPKLKNITGADFNSCEKLKILILGADTVCTLANINALTGTPIANGTGYVYVPKVLVEDYKIATNWATYASQIRAIEDYPGVIIEWDESESIPEEYQRVEYIQSTRVQLIDTKFKPTNNTQVQLDLKFSDLDNTGTVQQFMGVTDPEGNQFSFNFGGSADQAYEIFFWVNMTGANGGSYVSHNFGQNTILNRNTFTVTNTNVSYNGVSKSLTKGDWAVLLDSLKLFGRSNSSGELQSFSRYKMTLYGAKIWEGGALVRQYIPCYRKSDGIAGLYDRVTQEFYYSEGTENFVIGEEVE